MLELLLRISTQQEWQALAQLKWLSMEWIEWSSDNYNIAYRSDLDTLNIV